MTDAPPTLPPETSRAEARAHIARRFRAAGLDEPEREATLAITHACHIRPVALIAAPEAALGAAAGALEALVRRRLAGEPLSRIVGRRDFWTLSLSVTPDVLDPRADTETLIEAALAGLRERKSETLSLVDFGVGSGAILAALLTELPNARGLGVDRSDAAAAVARANLARLGLAGRSEVRVADWGAGLEGPFDLIVSNPPYIASDEIAALALEVREHDPRLALDGGPDGLDAYRALAPQIARLLAPRGLFALEFGAGQGPEVAALLSAAGLRVDGFRRDLGGHARVVFGAVASPSALGETARAVEEQP